MDRRIECVPSTLHGCIMYLENGVVHCIWMDEESFSHCNLVDFPHYILIISTHIYTKIIHVNHDPLLLIKNSHKQLDLSKVPQTSKDNNTQQKKKNQF